VTVFPLVARSHKVDLPLFWSIKGTGLSQFFLRRTFLIAVAAICEAREPALRSLVLTIQRVVLLFDNQHCFCSCRLRGLYQNRSLRLEYANHGNVCERVFRLQVICG